MLEVAEAQRLVLAQCHRGPVTASRLEAVLGMVLAEDVTSDIDVPPFDKSLMDGYAIRSADATATGATLNVIEEVSAGHLPTKPLGPGNATRIMTGAQLPVGADAVVMIERTEMVDGMRVRLREAARPEQNVLRAAREMRCGDTVLRAGTVLRPQEIGLLATVGKALVPVFGAPNVGIVATGDEIVEPDQTPKAGQIRNSNAYALCAQVQRAGGTPHYLGIALDAIEHLHSLLAKGLKHDVLLITGGVSAGNKDLVPEVLRALGVQCVFHKIRMKPGKPLFFGVKERTLVFGLPGNPVSTLVGFELFVRPALRYFSGHANVGPTFRDARLTGEFSLKSDRTTYYPGLLTATGDGWDATPTPWLGSPDLRAISGANCFIVFEPDREKYQQGEVVHVLDPE